jgi:hypothetical protein
MEVRQMACTSCGSVSVDKFAAEICIHFAGTQNMDRPHVLVFPQLLICLDCGAAQFAVSPRELRLLSAKADVAA